VLGRQGLWPGRRWQGRRGVVQAVQYVGSVQVDPLNIVGHSQDLALLARIDGYRPEYLRDALYKRRVLFEWGGNAQIRPISELPYLRVVMQRTVAEERWRRFARANLRLLASVTHEIESRGPLGPGDIAGAGERRIQNYRAAKKSGLALYYLWLKGEVTIADRRDGEKRYDLADRLLRPSAAEVPVPDAEEHLILGTLRHLGIATRSEWLRHAWPRIARISLREEWPDRVRRWQDRGVIQEVEVDGWRGRHYIPGDALPDLELLRSSAVPRSWRPLSTTTDEEAVFLAPLEIVSARGRSTQLFDFEYIWEVYKPASQRRWGYYTLPVLYGSSLCARIEMSVDRSERSLSVVRFWPERSSISQDQSFARALGRALRRLADFNGVPRVEVAGLHAPVIARRVSQVAGRAR
jgi:uncharacterized protein